MNIKVNNEADSYALAQLASLQNPRSLLAILAEYINTIIPEQNEETVTVTIKRDMMPESYRSNASLFGIRLLSKCPTFSDSSGYQSPVSNDHVTIKLLCTRKPHNARYVSAFPTLKRSIKEWLNLNKEKSCRLRIPIPGIPPFFFSHPEQLVYQIKKETNAPIKILKLTKHWIIARK